MTDLKARVRTFVVAVSANFEHVMAMLKALGRAHNALVDDVDALAEGLAQTNLEVDDKSNAGHNHDHGALTSLTGDHDAEYINENQAAGGVLGGTYPNPSFAVDMATQAELDAHTGDTSDAHDASAISILDSGGAYTDADVEGALEEIAVGVYDHDHSGPSGWAGENDLNPATANVGLLFAGRFTYGIVFDTLSGDVNDYAPTGAFTDGSVLSIDAGGAARIITGINGPDLGGVILVVHNNSTPGTGETLTLAHNDAGSSASNRFYFASEEDLVLDEQAAAWFVWDDVYEYWKMIGGSGGGGAVAAEDVTVADADGNFTGTDVEAVLDELYDLFTDETTQDQYIFVTANDFLYDDAVAAAGGTTPDLVGQANMQEASGRTGLYFTHGIPSDWDGVSAFEYDLIWYTSSSTGNVRFLLSISELAPTDTPSEVSSVAEAGTTVADSTTVKVTNLYNAFTPADAGNIVKVNLERSAAAAADTATGNVRVLAVRIKYTATGVPGPPGPAGSSKMAYSWYSRPHVSTGIGRRHYADRAFTIQGVYLEVSDEAPTGTLTGDVLLNGTSIYAGGGTKPTITAGNFLGAESTDMAETDVAEGDKLECEIEGLGGVSFGRVGFIIKGEYV